MFPFAGTPWVAIAVTIELFNRSTCKKGFISASAAHQPPRDLWLRLLERKKERGTWEQLDQKVSWISYRHAAYNPWREDFFFSHLMVQHKYDKSWLRAVKYFSTFFGFRFKKNFWLLANEISRCKYLIHSEVRYHFNNFIGEDFYQFLGKCTS